ncbi:SMP-30/gluconolactonase/LRE family protein [Kribbella sp. NBC_01245]|uniref:SMP-30/gluconolactonase/LRE family protein n=1 Tax=Kribbella sp. NBC_01245 TaxID=2903578 RepID=UPI002E28D085|nr:SMP-30/gluconolactonase/LRE family protein [Kribbella sp. NBC_01245]
MSPKSSIAPVRWTPPPAVPPHAKRAISVTVVPMPGEGPEDTLLDAEGNILTGLLDGRILRISADTKTITELANTGGRPLGLEWLPDGKVLVCDAGRGLLRLDLGTGELETLAAEIDGVPMKFCNNAAVAADGTIYFTDSSTRFSVDEWMADLLEHSATGRLFRRTTDGKVTKLADGLAFPNGVALSADGNTLFFVETAGYRLLKLDLTTEGAKPELVVMLPGLPDNISTGSDGLIWIAIGSPRNALLDFLLDKPPVLRKIVWALPDALKPKAASVIDVQAYDETGRLVHDLRGRHAGFHGPTAAREADGKVWLASIMGTSLAVFDVPEN